jgi:aspartate aminotransferase
MLSERAKLLKPSPTLAMAAKATELQAAGKDVISLTVGEPDWGTVQVANEAAIHAIQEGYTKYTPAAGLPALKKAIAGDLEATLGVKYAPADICVGAGAKYVLYAAFQMLLQEGDEVLIPAPYWVSYPTMVELADAKPVAVPTTRAQNFKATPADLDKYVSEKTKMLILCSPSNPTGIMYSKGEIEALAGWLKKHPQVWIVSDDIYNRLVFTGERVAPHLLQVAPDLASRMIVVNGASKAYAMTGWRVGWGAGPSAVMKPMADFLSQSTSNVCSITQHATIAALLKGEPELLETLEVLKKRKKIAAKQFADNLKYFEVVDPQGAFYFWTCVEKCLGKSYKGAVLKDDKQIAEILLTDFLVATIPGVEFGTPGYLRLSLAISEEKMFQAITRFIEFESQLS